MEGYLFIGTKKTAKSRFKKVWAVLDSLQLTCYLTLDLEEQLPKQVYTVIQLRNSTISTLAVNGVSHGIYIKSKKGKAGWYFDCTDGQRLQQWHQVFIRTMKDAELENERRDEPARCRLRLGFEPNEVLSTSAISKAYKKACLREHPDKGGSVEVFNQIRHAYDRLMSLQHQQDEKDNTVGVQYEAILRKGDSKAGLGIVVIEDKVHRSIIVQRVQPTINLVGITAEADGEIREGDRLIGIDKDECAHWYFSRVRARLNNFRLPIGSTVVLTLERRVPREEERKSNSSFEYVRSLLPARAQQHPNEPIHEQNDSNIENSSGDEDSGSESSDEEEENDDEDDINEEDNDKPTEQHQQDSPIASSPSQRNSSVKKFEDADQMMLTPPPLPNTPLEDSYTGSTLETATPTANIQRRRLSYGSTIGQLLLFEKEFSEENQAASQRQSRRDSELSLLQSPESQRHLSLITALEEKLHDVEAQLHEEQLKSSRDAIALDDVAAENIVLKQQLHEAIAQLAQKSNDSLQQQEEDHSQIQQLQERLLESSTNLRQLEQELVSYRYTLHVQSHQNAMKMREHSNIQQDDVVGLSNGQHQERVRSLTEAHEVRMERAMEAEQLLLKTIARRNVS